MKIDTEHSRVDAARKPQDLRTMLLGSTTIPALGMTIAEASQKTADLLAENDGPGPLTDEQADVLAAQWSALENAVTGAMPHTILDAASILDRIFPDDATHIPQRDIPALRRVATFLHQVAETARTASPTATSIIPSIGMTFRQAADRVRELLERGDAILKDDPKSDTELESVEAQRTAECREWCRIEDAMMATPAQTMGDLLAKLERIACPYIGIRAMDPSDAELLMLEEDVKKLRPLLTAPDISLQANGCNPDTPIFAAYNRWSQLVRDCYATEIDEDVDSLSEQADEAALEVMTHEPATREGLAAQVFVMLHLEHGGTVSDALDIDFSAMSGGDGPDSAAVHALVERVKRLGRRDGGKADALQRHVKLEEADRHPGGRHDTDVFNAYDALLKAMRAESALPDSASDEERERYEEAMEAAADHLVTLAPATPHGAAILLRYLFLRTCSTIEAERAFLRGDEPNEEDLTDYQALILWRTVKMLEALPAAANDQHQEPDAFADTVAAFEAEAPVTLALPQEPTGRMVDAGASAAGITPAQFQAAYAAAVEALKLERAA